MKDVRDVLEDAVRKHLVSDVPVAAFLSGGIDSTVVVALMSRVASEAPRTFTVVFPEREFSEAPFARAVADRYRTVHEEIRLSEGDLLGELPSALAAMDQPTVDGVNSYVVSRAVSRAGIKVALSGLGGDELFGGYPSFSRVRSARLLRAIPRSLRRTLARAVGALTSGAPRIGKMADMLDAEGTDVDVYRVSRELFGRAELSRMCADFGAMDANGDRIPRPAAGADPFLAVSLCELRHYMTNTLLRDTDFMSMASSLEVRVPFVDREVVRTVLAVPSHYKTDGVRSKPLLLDAAGDLVPEDVWRRPKMGFTLPFVRWMRSSLRDEIGGAFADDDRLAALGVRPAAVRALWERFLAQPERVGWSRPWSLYVLAKWASLHGLAS